MKRLVGNLLTALSLLLCVASVAMWVRSYWVFDAFTSVTHLSGQEVRWLFADSEAGALGFGTRAVNLLPEDPYENIRPGSWERQPASRAEWRGNLRPQVIQGQYKTGVRTMESTQVWLPYWLIVTTTAIGPAVSAWRRRRHGVGLCPSCGYDLRATPQKCPECGHAPAGAAA